MKRLFIFVLAMALIMIALPVFAGERGASERALERASDEAIFHRVGDWFATRGKSEEEAKVIIGERKAKRAVARAQKAAEKEKKKLEKEARKAKKQLKKKAKGIKFGE